jgi:hypothetical protein
MRLAIVRTGYNPIDTKSYKIPKKLFETKKVLFLQKNKDDANSQSDI